MRWCHPLCLVLSALFFASTFSGSAAAQAICKLSTTNRTVTICTPANGATVGTTFHVNAGTTDSYGIQYIEVYVQYKLYAIQHTNYLDATITVPAGNHLNLTVQAHDLGGVTIHQTYFINVTGTAYTISPTNPTLGEGSTQQFTASLASTWSATCGSISSSGMFTAPLAQPACKVTGKATDGTGRTASTNVAISSPISVTPTTATTPVNGTQQFNANESVNWAASCGSISSSGLFTAPATPGTCTITATAASGTAYTAAATDAVTTSTAGVPNYTTWKNDNARDGLQAQETILTPTNVNANGFGQVFSTSVDGSVWAQPLFMSGITIGGAKHNVVYAATSNDSVYAIDGDTGTQLWKKGLLMNGETPASGTTLHSSVPTIGITGTPVIDPTTNTLYAVTQSGISGTYYHRLHALDLATGAEKFGAPVVINASGWQSSQHLQRPGLLLANGNVYIAFGGNDDIAPYHGWIFAYNAGNLSQVAAWNNTPGGGLGGIWMGGAGLAADASGNIFHTSGNGDWNGTSQFGQSAVKMGATLDVLDYFTPIAHATETQGDKDLGSGGIVLLPPMNGPHPNEAINCSKLNVIYVIDRDNMGQIGTTTDNVVQQVTGQLGATSGTQYTDRCFSNPAYWNNNLYFIGNNDGVKQFTIDPSTGLMSTTPVYKDTFAYLFPGGQPVVSANGNSNGIVWGLDWKTGTLHAYDATNVSKVLYVSPQLGTGIKFTVPTVVNGHVYAGLVNKVVGLGLKGSTGGSCTPPSSAGAVVCAPTSGGTYSSPVTVTAAGTGASGAVNHMELWIDGKKINDYFSNQINTSVSLASGSHALTAVEVDSTGAYLKSGIVNFTIQ